MVVARARPTVRMIRPRRLLLGGEDVLDRERTRPRRGVAAGDVRRHRLAARLRPLELGGQAAPDQQRDVGGRAIGGIGPDAARRVVGSSSRRAGRRRGRRRAVTVNVRMRPCGGRCRCGSCSRTRHGDLVGRGRCAAAPLAIAFRGRASASSGRRGRSARARAGVQPSGTPPPLIVVFSSWSAAAAAPGRWWRRRSGRPLRGSRPRAGSHRSGRTAARSRPPG